jgi:hypothetical protein
MEYNKVLEVLAPCGLSCQKCMAYASGDIQYHSEKLKELLGSFENYAKRFSKMWPIFGNYPQFKELLGHFYKPTVPGAERVDVNIRIVGLLVVIRLRMLISVFNVRSFLVIRRISMKI